MSKIIEVVQQFLQQVDEVVNKSDIGKIKSSYFGRIKFILKEYQKKQSSLETISAVFQKMEVLPISVLKPLLVSAHLMDSLKELRIFFQQNENMKESAEQVEKALDALLNKIIDHELDEAFVSVFSPSLRKDSIQTVVDMQKVELAFDIYKRAQELNHNEQALNAFIVVSYLYQSVIAQAHEKFKLDDEEWKGILDFYLSSFKGIHEKLKLQLGQDRRMMMDEYCQKTLYDLANLINAHHRREQQYQNIHPKIDGVFQAQQTAYVKKEDDEEVVAPTS